MSDKEDTKEETETTEVKRNPFLERLEENQRAKAKIALVQTICENPQQTIGAILDALDADDTGDYIMLDLFKRMTIEELIVNTANQLSGKATPASASSWTDQDDIVFTDDEEDDDEEEDDEDDEEIDLDDEEFEDDDDDLVDDDEEDDEVEDDDEEEEETPASKKKKSKKGKGKGKKGKKGSKGKKSKKGTKSKKDNAPVDGPKKLGAYKKAILKALRKAGEPTSAQKLKEMIGGDDDLFTPAKDELIDAEEIDSEGKARGTKYFIVE